MKKKVQRSLVVVFVLSMIVSLVAYTSSQVKLIHDEFISESRTLLSQIDKILGENEREAQTVTQEFRQECMGKARAGAFIVQNRPDIMDSAAEAKKVAEMINVDEIHFFDTEGTIVAGSEPKYYGLNFSSGEQMQFFLPMLSDRSLQLCQPITPNTAEGKMMQYAAVWREDGRGIVQIGVEPDHVLATTKKNELSYIFSLLTTDDHSTIYAVDSSTYEILGSTDEKLVGSSLSDIGISKSYLKSEESLFHANINGNLNFAVFTKADDEGVILGRTAESREFHMDIVINAAILSVYLVLLAVVMYFVISRYLDKTILQGIHQVNRKLQRITDGNLGEKVNVNKTPEFEELSGHINLMVRSILESADKLSSVLDMADIRIGMFEYRENDKQVRVTAEVWDILGIPEENRQQMLKNYESFDHGINAVIDSPVEGEEDVFRLRGEELKYFKINVFVRDESVFGLLMDVTKDITEKKRIEHERDEDPLTGLYVRRAFHARAFAVMEHPEELKHAAVLIMDADNLKKINDHYGHIAGDRYLCGISRIIASNSAPNKITARISGDEFAQMIYGCETKAELLHYVEEMIDAQSGSEIQISKTISVPISFSVGFALYPDDSFSFNDLVKLADERMYKNKWDKKVARQADTDTDAENDN